VVASGASIGHTSAADIVFQCEERMFHPGLSDLFEAIRVPCSAAHSIKILRNDRMIGVRQREPIHRLIAIVTRVSPYGEIKLRADVPHLGDVFDLSDNHIRTMHQVRRVWTHRMLDGRYDHRFCLAINKLVDLDRLHRRANGDFPNDRTGV